MEDESRKEIEEGGQVEFLLRRPEIREAGQEESQDFSGVGAEDNEEVKFI